jgi:hypothetical protein
VIAIQHILAVNEEKTALDDASETCFLKNLAPSKRDSVPRLKRAGQGNLDDGGHPWGINRIFTKVVCHP